MANRTRNEKRSLIGSRSASPSHRSSLWSGAIAIFLLCFFALYRIAGDDLYDYPVNEASAKINTDAVIICLAGGKRRIESAFELYASGIGSALLVVGAGPKTNLQTLLKGLPKEVQEKINPRRQATITVEIESKNTLENAFVVNRFVQQNPQVKDIVFVTSSYHMRRALFILQSMVHDNIVLHPYTPGQEQINKENWYKTWVGIEVTGYEYLKYLLAKIIVPQLHLF